MRSKSSSRRAWRARCGPKSILSELIAHLFDCSRFGARIGQGSVGLEPLRAIWLSETPACEAKSVTIGLRGDGV